MANSVSLLPTAAVVIAHGPTGTTLTTLNRVGDLVGEHCPIVVIAGTAPGLTAVERASERGYSVVEDHGPAALERVLANLDGTVLVMHDDIVVTRHSVAAMVMAHAQTGLTAVPGSGRGCAKSTVNETDLACAVGDANTLAALAAQSGFGPGLVTPGDFVVAADTEVTHSAECRKRLAEGASQSDAPLLVAALIVRDESEHLAECLASLERIVDRVEVADTGSVDNTMEIALSHGANVTEIEWRDDFAWARNQVLDRCRDATFVLWMDADERFRCAKPKRFRQVLRTYERLYPSYCLEIHNYSRDVETHSFWAKRIVNPSGVQFEGALHEQARRMDGAELLEVPSALCSVDHYGYGKDVLDARGKLERNLEIARTSFELEPTAERAVHYARSLEAASTDPVATLAAMEPLLDLVEAAPDQIKAMLWALRGKVQLEAGDYEAAATTAEAAARLVPADAVAGAVLAEALVRLGRPADALQLAAELAGQASVAPAIVDRLAANTRAHTLFDAALSLDRLVDAVDTLGDLPPSVDPWPALADLGGTEALVGLAGRAGELNDERFMSALIERSDITRSQLVGGRDAFLRGGVTQLDTEIVEAALLDLDRVESAIDLRRRFDASGDVADAVAYADALSTGHLDLTLELESAADHPHGVSIALGLAAEALRRRERPDEAADAAITAVQLWPGSVRGAAIVAQSAITGGKPEIALEMIDAARSSGAMDGVSLGRRQELTNRAVDAHLGLGNIPGAVSEALEIVEQRGVVDSWSSMLQMVVDDTDRLTLVLGLALLSDGNDFLAAAGATLRPEKTAELCAAFLVSGGLNPEAVTMGLLAACLRDRLDLAEVIAEYAYLLDDDVRPRLASRLRSAGAETIAAKLDNLEVVAVPDPI